MSLYATAPATVGTHAWRFTIDSATGRGGYEFCRDGFWLPFHRYEPRKHGLVTLNELDQALYHPNRASIAQARAAVDRMGRDYTLRQQHNPGAQASLI